MHRGVRNAPPPSRWARGRCLTRSMRMRTCACSRSSRLPAQPPPPTHARIAYLSSCAQILSLSPGCAKALAKRAQAREANGELQDAIEDYRAAADSAPPVRAADFGRGRAMLPRARRASTATCALRMPWAPSASTPRLTRRARAAPTPRLVAHRPRPRGCVSARI